MLAHYSTSTYIWANSACTDRKDPLNLTFYTNSTRGNTVTHIEHHLNWLYDSGSTMYVLDHGQCLQVPEFTPIKADQRASGPLTSERDHLRLRQGVDGDATWGTYSAAFVHHDVFRQCGITELHVANDFIVVRDAVVQAFRNQPGHGTELWVNNGNTAPSPQCDGSQPQGDGRTAWISIP